MGTYNTSNKILNIKDFQHPADRKSVAAVMAVPGLNKLLEFISQNSLERTYGFINNSSRLKITPAMSPKIHAMLEEAAAMYGETYIPEVYLERNYTYLINLDGMTKPHIILPDTWLEAVDDKMLFAILSAQIAGIQVTDDCALAEFAGFQVKLCPIATPNLKITTPEDLDLITFYLKERKNG